MTQPLSTNGPVPDRPARPNRPAPANRGVAIGAGVILWAMGWVFVVLALQAGYDAADAEYTGTPVCDGQVMSPGDTCIVFGNGAGQSGTYEEIVAENERDAKAEAWGWAEAQGALGAALVLFGMGTAGFRGRLPKRAHAWVFTCVAMVPLLGVAAVVWWLQSRANAASPVPVGVGGLLLRELPDVPYSAWLTALVVAVVALGYFSAIFDWGTAQPSPGQTAAHSSRATTGRGGSVSTEASEKEERLKAWEQRRKDAEAAFDKGESDDPWIAHRIPRHDDTAPPPASSTRGARLTRAMGAAVFLLACALSAAPWIPGLELPFPAAPAVTALVGWVLFSWHGKRRFPPGSVARSYGGFALLSLAAAVTTVFSLPEITWSGLLNTLAFACGFLILTVWLGPSLPRPPVAGRVVCSVNGLAQLVLAAALVVAARAPGSRGLVELVTYLAATLFVLYGWLSFDRAGKTESLGAVPAAVSAACLGTSALALTLTACWVVFADIGPLGWVVATLYTLGGLLQIKSALARLRPGRRPLPNRSAGTP